MIEEAVARRYARALFAASEARDLLDRGGEELTAITVALRRSPRLWQILRGPQIEEAAKLRLLSRAFADRVHPLVFELLELLLEKKRIDALPEIAAAYRTLVAEHRGIVQAEVVTAVPLPADLEERLVERLASRTGKRIEIEKRVDPDILGGAIVRMGDRVIDGSVRRTLEEIGAQLREADIHI